TKVEGSQVYVTFDSIGGGVIAEGGPFTGFEVCGEDRKFAPAQARLAKPTHKTSLTDPTDGRQRNTVIVWADGVEKPVAVRFGWKNCPEVNLFNKEGLPASPFRTDDFPLTSEITKD